MSVEFFLTDYNRPGKCPECGRIERNPGFSICPIEGSTLKILEEKKAICDCCSEFRIVGRRTSTEKVLCRKCDREYHVLGKFPCMNRMICPKCVFPLKWSGRARRYAKCAKCLRTFSVSIVFSEVTESPKSVKEDGESGKVESTTPTLFPPPTGPSGEPLPRTFY